MYVSDRAKVSASRTLWEKEKFSYVMILHRSVDGEILQTPIKTEEGALYVAREDWAGIHAARFKRLEDLVQALIFRGMSQVPGRMDRVKFPGLPLPGSLEEQLSKTDMFMLDDLYGFQVQYDSSSSGGRAFPLSVIDNGVSFKSGAPIEIRDVRFDTVDAALDALNHYGEAKLLDWGFSLGVRLPEFN